MAKNWLCRLYKSGKSQLSCFSCCRLMGFRCMQVHLFPFRLSHQALTSARADRALLRNRSNPVKNFRFMSIIFKIFLAEHDGFFTFRLQQSLPARRKLRFEASLDGFTVPSKYLAPASPDLMEKHAFLQAVSSVIFMHHGFPTEKSVFFCRRNIS